MAETTLTREAIVALLDGTDRFDDALHPNLLRQLCSLALIGMDAMEAREVAWLP